ncbi:unnamed protein product, partial [Owenia fusiformis]
MFIPISHTTSHDIYLIQFFLKDKIAPSTVDLVGELIQFMGKWFEVKAWFHRIEGFSDYDAWNDFSKVYTKKSDGVADVFETGRVKNSDNCNRNQRGRILFAGGRLHPARLTLGDDNSTYTMAMYVVATDYDNYALTVGCSHEGKLYASGTCLPDPIVHVLSRTTILQPGHARYLDDIINKTICHADL